MRKGCILLFLLPVLAHGAITHEETASNSGSIAAASNLTVTMAGAASDGELLVATCHRDDSNGNQAATGFPAGWTKAAAISVATTDERDRVIDVGYKIASSEGTTYQFTNNGSNEQELHCAILVYSDVNATQLDISPTGSHYAFLSNSDAPDPPAISGVSNGAIVLAIATASGAVNTRSCTAPSGYTLRHGASDPIANAFLCVAEKSVTTDENPGAFSIANGNDCGGLGCSDDTYAATIAIAPSAAGSDSVLFFLGH